MKKRLGIVIQTFGVEVNGGAEVHTRMIAEKLSATYQVTVLTSRALDFRTWEPHYPAGPSVENGIEILRFTNSCRRSGKEQEYWGRKIRGRHFPQKVHRWMGKPKWLLKFFPQAGITLQDGVAWLEAQGPCMPDLLSYLTNNEKVYAAFIFITAAYYPSAMGVLTVPHKSILIPTMHDERSIYGEIYQKVMAAPQWLLFNTRAEQKFSENLFSIGHVHKRIAGVGIERFADCLFPDKTVLAQYRITKPYLIYVGRIDSAKGCDTLINFFLRYVTETGQEVKLVMVGKNFMEPILHPNIAFTGFVAEEVKRQLMLQATALVIPSAYESLSLVLLESFGCRVPVVANGQTEVLKDHIDDSSGGWCYTDYVGFKQAVSEATTNPDENARKGAAAYQYVKKNYSWEKVMAVFGEAIADVQKSNRVIKI